MHRRGFTTFFYGLLLTSPMAALSQKNAMPRNTSSMNTNSPNEAILRKERSEAILSKEGVPLNKHLPGIETEDECKRRTKEEVGYRALALLTVAVKGEGLEQKIVDRVIADFKLSGHFTPKEQAFISEPNPMQRDRVQFSWRYEAAWTLLWALGYVRSLGKPDHICDVAMAVGFMKDRGTDRFIAEAKLRPLADLLEEADRIYRYHWAIVDARLKGQAAPAKLEPGVTLERHYALNWLIGYMEQEWDEISTDT